MTKKLRTITVLSTLFFILSPFFIPLPVKAAESDCVIVNVNIQGPPVNLPPNCKTNTLISGKIPLYKQWDPQWGSQSYGCGKTIAQTGCGITSLAMLITYFSGKTVLPSETARVSLDHGWRVCGNGTAWAAMTGMPKLYGLTGKTISWTEAKRYLEQDIPVIQTHSAGYFTGGGHYIVVTGKNTDGTYAINDPDGFHRTRATESQITSTLKGNWVIQK